VQLELFEGEHIPLLRARAALEEGDLRGAHEALAEAFVRADLQRGAGALVQLERLLPAAGDAPRPSPERVHAVFEEALAEEARSGRGPIPAADWFRLYAVHMAGALGETPARRFRGWWQLHYELAARRSAPALASAERLASTAARLSLKGSPWLEAARAAYACGRTDQAHRWMLVACLTSDEPLDPAPPRLDATGRNPLDAPDGVLPELPDATKDLFGEASVLELPGPASGWVPCLGVLQRVFGIAALRCTEVERAAGFDLARDAPPDEPSPRAFLRALVAAHEARAREPGRCGARELAARTAMKRASPPLFARYMETLGLYG
jgi:hypothetical protein